MRTVTPPPRRAASRAGARVALAVVLGLLVAGCGAPDGAEPDPGAAPSVAVDGTGGPGATTSDAPSSPTPSPATPSATPDDGATPRQGADDGAGKPGSEERERARAAQEKAEQEKAAQERAEQERREREEREREEQERRDAMPRYGDSGERVVALQERLVELGYFLQEVDGSFGPATQQAVWALQKAAGLVRDGVVGPRTQAALDAGTRPDARTSSGRVVEIDLDRQLLMTVEDGRVTRIVNASSGNGEQYQALGRTYTASTPRGSYAVYMRRDYLHESTLELGSMWRPQYFSGGYAVHGSGSVPPYPASHGCVRVSNAAMNWLWDSWGMGEGTPVVLY